MNMLRVFRLDSVTFRENDRFLHLAFFNLNRRILKMLDSSGSFRRGMLRGSIPWLLRQSCKYLITGGWGIELHNALQQRPPVHTSSCYLRIFKMYSLNLYIFLPPTFLQNIPLHSKSKGLLQAIAVQHGRKT